jgi:branched-chain amino acid aminotransferase
MRMPKMMVWKDGEFLAYDKVGIPPLAHSLSYANAVYEGIRSYGGKIFMLERHLQRLHRSAAIFGHDGIPGDDELEAAIRQLIVLNRVPDAYIKIQVALGDGDLSPRGKGCKSLTIITAMPFAHPRPQGVRLAVADWLRPPTRCHPYAAKSSAGYSLAYLSLRAMPSWADDVLFLTASGEVCETSGSNIFFLRGADLFTPRTDHCLDGITRQIVLDTIGPSLKLATHVEEIRADDIDKFEGAFLTGTAYEIIEVSGIGQMDYDTSLVTSAIREAYGVLTRGI